MSQGPGTAEPARLRELDALRGLAALAVMLYHYTYHIAGIMPGPLPSVQLQYGCYGVPLFFAISGFVIASSLAGTRTLGQFAWRRAIRLLPCYWLCLFMTSMVVAAAGAARFAVPLADLPDNLLMIQLWTGAKMIDGVYWTLNVELAFYLCMAAIWRAGLLDRIEPVIGAWLLLPVFWSSRPDLLPDLRDLLVAGDAPFFALGILAARIWSGQRGVRQQAPWIAAAVLAVAASRPAEFTPVALLVASIMLAVATGRASAIARAPLLWLGRVSYPLYLIHGVIGYVVIAKLRTAGLSPDVSTLIAIAFSLGLAGAIAHLYDEPLRKWLGARLQRGVARRALDRPGLPT